MLGVKNVTHETIGATGALALCAIAGADVLTTAGCVVVSVLGSRLPDADQHGSKIHRKTGWERRNPLIALLGFLARIPLVVFASIVRHRGATHWLSTGVAVTVIGTVAAGAIYAALVLPVAAGLGAGYTLHLLADGCTPHGVPLLGPFSRRKRHLLPKGGRIRTGSGRETVVCLAAMCVAGLVVALTWA
jgi:inner membrane protein